IRAHAPARPIHADQQERAPDDGKADEQSRQAKTRRAPRGRRDPDQPRAQQEWQSEQHQEHRRPDRALAGPPNQHADRRRSHQPMKTSVMTAYTAIVERNHTNDCTSNSSPMRKWIHSSATTSAPSHRPESLPVRRESVISAVMLLPITGRTLVRLCKYKTRG